MHWKLVGTCTGASVFLLALVALSFLIRQTLQDAYLSLALLVLGLTIGWVLGILSAPYTKKEETQFAVYAKAASVFVSGYLLGKVDRLATHILSPEVLLKPMAAFRAVAFVAAVLLAALITRTFRVYWA
jgi:hypothetical protein